MLQCNKKKGSLFFSPSQQSQKMDKNNVKTFIRSILSDNKLLYNDLGKIKEIQC